MAEGRVAGAEIVDRDLATQVAHDRKEARGIVQIVQRRRLGDLHDEAAGQVGAVLEARDQRPKPAAVGRCDAGDIDRQHHAGMALQIVQNEVERAPVERPHHAQALDHRHELARDHDVSGRREHAEQTFVEAHLVGRRVDDRLVGEGQAIFLHRTGHLFAEVHVGAVAQALLFRQLIQVQAIAPGRLGLQQRTFGLGDDIEAGARLVGEVDGADRGRDVKLIAGRLYRQLANALQYPFADRDRTLFAAGMQ